MHASGHQGLSMLVYAPLAYLLVAAGYPVLALWGCFIMLSLASFPDVDMRVPGMTHRGFSHTLLFGLVVAAVLGAGAALFGDVVIIGGINWLVGMDTLPQAFTSVLNDNSATLTARYGGGPLGTFTFVISFLGICSHLLGDIVTPMGIEPFWPLSGANFSFGLFYAGNALANALFFLVGWLAVIAAGVLGTGVIGQL